MSKPEKKKNKIKCRGRGSKKGKNLLFSLTNETVDVFSFYSQLLQLMYIFKCACICEYINRIISFCFSLT